jgi:hypothetical protein
LYARASARPLLAPAESIEAVEELAGDLGLTIELGRHRGFLLLAPFAAFASQSPEAQAMACLQEKSRRSP